MNEIRIIKKYPNRRLYDTGISSYITLDNVKELVQQQISFQVVDARNKMDLTQNTLLQIFMEQEESEKPLLTNSVLQYLIRQHGDGKQSIMSRFFERSVPLFFEQKAPAQTDNVDHDIEKKNKALWQLITEECES